MKKLFLSVFIILIVEILFSQNSNFEFQNNIERLLEYNKTNLILSQNKIYLNAPNSIEIFNYSDDGHIFFENYIPKPSTHGLSFIKGDSLVCIEGGYSLDSYIKVYNLNNNSLIFQKTLEFQDIPFQIFTNHDYLFCNLYLSNRTFVYDINNFNFVTSFTTRGHSILINNNYLFLQDFNQNNNSELSLYDITDIYNFNFITHIYLNNISNIRRMKFENNKLFILFDNEVQIWDYSNIHNPFLISTIQNLPLSQYSAMNNLITYQNYLIVYDCHSLISIYDISNVQNPIYEATIHDCQSTIWTNIFPFIKIDKSKNIMFLSNDVCKLSSFDISNLPQLTLIDSNTIPQGEYLITFTNNENKIFFGTFPEGKLKFYNINTNTVTPIYNSGYIYSSNCLNDSLFCCYNNNFGGNLKFFKIFSDTLMYYSQIITGTLDDFDYSIVGNNLLLYNHNLGRINIKSLNDADFGEDIGEIAPDVSEFNLIPRKYNVLNDYIFIIFNQGGTTKIRIYENTPPFNQISEFYLIYPDHYMAYILSDNLILRENEYNSKSLCSFDLPNNVQELDTISDSLSIWDSTSGSYFVDDKIIWEYTTNIYNHINHSKIKFIPILNNHFGTPFIYDFKNEIYSLFFYPYSHKLYVMGRYFIQEYSYQLSGSDDDYITPISKPIMINYPNPFNPSTTISFTLKEKGHKNKIAIYNLKGEKVKELTPTNCKIGKNTITWNGKNNNGKKVASGVYLYSLIQDGKAIVTKKMVMVK